MKVLKVIGIIVGVLIAAILIVPLFSPSTAEVSSEIEIALEPVQIFPSVASFDGRDAWDPWMTTDSTADAIIEPKPGYVGSSYSWNGETTGTGKMVVTAVTENEYIKSDLFFGDMEEPSLVEWNFQEVDGGTRVTWSFAQETTYPFSRLGMMIGKVFLKKSYDLGLSNLKAHLEANPPKAGPLGQITVGIQPTFDAMMARGAGTMVEIGQLLGELYGDIWAEIEKQGLSINGAAFVHYLDFDEATGFSNFIAGMPVNKPGNSSGDVIAKSYPEMEVVQGVHTGPYENLKSSYEALGEYVGDNGIEVSGGAFEFYIVSMQEDTDPANWQTVIAFPVK